MSKSIIVAAALALAAWSAPPAHAGYCGEEGALDAVQQIERYAKRGGKVPEYDDLCVDEAWYEPKLKRRILKACEAILGREPGYSSCLFWAASEGLKTHGGVDIFDALSKAATVDPLDPRKSQGGFYLSLGDARAVPLMRELWQQALGDPRVGKKKSAHEWKKFRNNATALFEKQGGAPERDFLAAQVAATKKDPALVKKMKKAIAAIDRRLAPKP